jgi:hypothetical protein
MYLTFWEKSVELLDELSKTQTHDFNIEVTEIFQRAALDVIGLAGFGVDFNSLKEPGNDLWTEYATASKPTFGAYLIFLLHGTFPNFHWTLDRLPLPRRKKSERALQNVRRRIERAIDRREKGAENGQAQRKDIIGFLMEQNLITDMDMLINQSLTILGAVHYPDDTSERQGPTG